MSLRHEEWLDALNMSLTKDICMPINFYLGLLEGEACHISGVHQHIFEKSNMFNSFLSLQNLFSSSGLVNMLASWSSMPTLSTEMSLFVDDLLWNGGRHQCALFLHVESDCWLAWLHSHCYIEVALSWTWFQSHSRWPSSKEFIHNNYRQICIRIRRLIM
jgi:hypothetical protein